MLFYINILPTFYLSVSNTIVKLHGGKIGVTSEGEGRGCTFYVDLPISKIERGSNYRHTSPAHKDISSKVHRCCIYCFAVSKLNCASIFVNLCLLTSILTFFIQYVTFPSVVQSCISSTL